MLIPWVEVRLPWALPPLRRTAEEARELEEFQQRLRSQVRAVFGVTLEESRAHLVERGVTGQEICELREAFPILRSPPRAEDWLARVESAVGDLASPQAERALLVARHWFAAYREDTWKQQHPEVQERSRVWRERCEAHDRKAFRNHPLCKSGVQIEVLNEHGTRLLLIGDVSPYGSADAGEDALSEQDFVARCRDFSPLLQAVAS